MFRITAHYDDPWHPLNGDVVTVASVAEALAAMPNIIEEALDVLEDLPRGCRESFEDYGVTYTVERI